MFGDSNPPPEVWEAMWKFDACDVTTEEIDAVVVFLRLHSEREGEREREEENGGDGDRGSAVTSFCSCERHRG